MSGKPSIWAAFVLFAMISGCIQAGSPPGENLVPPPDAPTEVASASEIRLVNCRSDSYGVLSASSDVAGRLPPGYTIYGYMLEEFTNVNLFLKSCEAAILDNETVIRPAQLATTEVRVSVNKTLQIGVVDHTYLFEVFASDSRLVEAFAARGFSAMLARIDLTGAPPVAGFKIEVGNRLWYEGQVAGGNVPGGEYGSHEIIHHQEDGFPPSWIDKEGKNRSTTTPSASGSSRRSGPARKARTRPGPFRERSRVR